MKKKKTKKKSALNYKIIIFSILFLIIALAGFLAGFLISHKQTQKEIKSYKQTLITLQNKINELSKEIKNSKKIEYIIPPVATAQNSEIIDYQQASKNQKPKKEHIESVNKKIKTNKPKLVIIIDDVAFRHEVQMLKSIPYKITPSFFPPTKRHPNTPIYAESFKDYMVHVPMEAMHFAHPESNTININWSYTQIKNRIDKIKKEFPKAKFINNHAGSKLTSNLQAMNSLFLSLKKDNLGFVDSKTTPYSKAKEAENVYKIPLFQRDIFLDNKQNTSYIKNQLKKAINIAKRRGYAIAIGHPHKVTLETIKNAKNLLNQVDVIYIDELSKYVKN